MYLPESLHLLCVWLVCLSVCMHVCLSVKVTVAMGKADVTMKIADEGGGASRTEMEQLWTYYYTTANKFLVGNANLPVRLT